MSKDMWMRDYEQACDDFMDDEDEQFFTARLRELGFDFDEIANEIAAAKGEL